MVKSLPMETAQKKEVGKSAATVDGTVKSVVFRNDETGFTILHVTPAADGRFRLAQSEVTVLGTCAAAWEGEELHAVGEWVDDPVRGRQFKAKSIECVPPKSVEGIRRYLASGLIHGIGPVLANRIVDRFGADTIDVLDRFSARLAWPEEDRVHTPWLARGTRHARDHDLHADVRHIRGKDHEDIPDVRP